MISVSLSIILPLLLLILPTDDGHPVKRVNYATEVNHDKQDRNQEGRAGPGRLPSHLATYFVVVKHLDARSGHPDERLSQAAAYSARTCLLLKPGRVRPA